MPTFAMRKIVKRFPGVVANRDVDITIAAGEIHALLGENGAGKSTLMQILYGFHSMDSGTILVDDKAVEIASPKAKVRLPVASRIASNSVSRFEARAFSHKIVQVTAAIWRCVLVTQFYWSC